MRIGFRIIESVAVVRRHIAHFYRERYRRARLRLDNGSFCECRQNNERFFYSADIIRRGVIKLNHILTGDFAHVLYVYRYRYFVVCAEIRPFGRGNLRNRPFKIGIRQPVTERIRYERVIYFFNSRRVGRNGGSERFVISVTYVNAVRIIHVRIVITLCAVAHGRFGILERSVRAVAETRRSKRRRARQIFCIYIDRASRRVNIAFQNAYNRVDSVQARKPHEQTRVYLLVRNETELHRIARVEYHYNFVASRLRYREHFLFLGRQLQIMPRLVLDYAIAAVLLDLLFLILTQILAFAADSAYYHEGNVRKVGYTAFYILGVVCRARLVQRKLSVAAHRNVAAELVPRSAVIFGGIAVKRFVHIAEIGVILYPRFFERGKKLYSLYIGVGKARTESAREPIVRRPTEDIHFFEIFHGQSAVIVFQKHRAFVNYVFAKLEPARNGLGARRTAHAVQKTAYGLFVLNRQTQQRYYNSHHDRHKRQTYIHRRHCAYLFCFFVFHVYLPIIPLRPR